MSGNSADLLCTTNLRNWKVVFLTYLKIFFLNLRVKTLNKGYNGMWPFGLGVKENFRGFCDFRVIDLTQKMRN